MPLATTTPRSLVEQAIDGMRDLLANGEWAVGTRIPPEPALAAALGVSRNTVREAVGALAHAGVLDVRRGDGTYVATSSEVTALMRRQLARTEMQHVLEVRQAIETQSAALAAQRRTKRDLTSLERALRRRAVAVEVRDEAAFLDADTDFHLGLVAATHNPLLSELYESFVETLRASVSLPDQQADELASDHEALLAAIRDQDPTAAAATAAGLLHHADRVTR